MITKKRLYSLSIMAIFATADLHSMENQNNGQPEQNAQEKSIKDDLLKAKKEFYDQQTASNKAMQELQEQINGTYGHSQRAVITKAVDLAGTWTDRGATIAFNELRKQRGWLTEEEEIAQDINRELRIARQKENILTESTNETKRAEKAFYDSQALNAEIDAAIKMCECLGRNQDGTYKNQKCQERIRDLWNKQNNLSEKSTMPR